MTRRVRVEPFVGFGFADVTAEDRVAGHGSGQEDLPLIPAVDAVKLPAVGGDELFDLQPPFPPLEGDRAILVVHWFEHRTHRQDDLDPIAEACLVLAPPC